MRKSLRFILAGIVVISMLLGPAALVSARQGPEETPWPLYLKNGAGDIPPGLLVANAAQNQHGYYIVQFRGPVEQAWKDAVTAEGAELLDYIPDFAFKARMNPGQARKVAGLDVVARVEDFQPAYKLNPNLVRAELGLYTVRVERGSDRALAQQAIAATGVEVVSAQDDRLVVAASAEQLDAIANVLDVAWVDNFRLNETQNEYGAGSVMGASAANSLGYDGSTQIVAVADTGIGGGTPENVHRDIPSSRVTAIYNWPGAPDSCFSTIYDDGAIDVDSGHGTHTAGSVLSDGDNGVGTGTAPGAKLVFQAVENYAAVSSLCRRLYGIQNGYYLLGLPADLRTLYQQAYSAGARVHSNSWGSDAAGDYTADSANTDSFVWSNRDMVITFSAGNAGIDANGDGVVDNDSTGSPATAKNVITVGATENGRTDNYPCDSGLSYTTCAAQGGANTIFTYGTAWPADFPANPIASDSSSGNIEQMAAFSSRGPADDGRIKPDVVAPGTWILSTYSDLYQQEYDATANPRNGAWQYDGWGFPYDSYYKYMGGTSMSNPLAAGGAAVVRDYFQKVYGVNASAALVKAVLINTATDLADENNDGASDNDFPIPNNHEGWGRVNLAAATDGSVRYLESAGLATNASASFSVTSTGAPLKVSVVWSDYPSTETAAINLVNDLDLTVTGPGGTFLGNVFSGGWSAAGGSADRRNNVENVYVASPGAGEYTITVRGYNVPNGPQPFALVVTGIDGVISGSVEPTPSPTPTPTVTPTPAPVSSTGYLQPSANAPVTKSAGDNNGFQTAPTNAYSDNAAFAEDPSSGTASGTICTSNKRDKHLFYNYNVSLPANAVVQGIEVRLDAKANSTSGTPTMCVQLSWDGGKTWTAAYTTTTLSTSEQSFTLGGPADTWGRAWTTANLGNTSLRVRVANLGTNTTTTYSLDYIGVNVTYR